MSGVTETRAWYETTEHDALVDLGEAVFRLEWTTREYGGSLEWKLYPVGGDAYRDGLRGEVRAGVLQIDGHSTDLAAFVRTTPEHVRALAEAFEHGDFRRDYEAVVAYQVSARGAGKLPKRHGE